MIQRDGLFFHEEIMLLALRDEEGTPEWGTMYEYAIGGAILARRHPAPKASTRVRNYRLFGTL